MKGKIGKYLAELRSGFGRVVRRYPVEVALQTVLTALFIWWTEADEFPFFSVRCLWILPLFSFGALVVNTWAGNGPWRRVYYVIWMPIVPLLCWSGLQEWIATEQFAVTLGILVPLALLLCRRGWDNRRFSADAVLYLRAAVVALLLANVALGLFQATLWSAAYIFGFEDVRWIARLSVDVCPVANFLIVPILFLMLLDRWEMAESRLSRIGEVLVNWILTPALIIYASLLHLYAAKILFAWSLPRGGVAYLVFGFMATAFVVRMLRELVSKRIAEWFYGRFGLVMLVPALLFWIGFVRRVGEYGLTAPRVYLLVCGIVMTFAVVIFFLRSGRYAWLFASAFVLFALTAYVPPLSPARIGLRSQHARFERLGRELGMLDSAGRFVERRVPLADTVRRSDYAEFFSAMRYIDERDASFRTVQGLGGRGIWSLEYDLLPWKTDSVVEVIAVDPVSEVELPRNARFRNDAAYHYICTNFDQQWSRNKKNGALFKSDTLRVMYCGRELLTISGEELVRRQMERTGVAFDALSELDREQALRFLDYRDERVRVLFRSIKVERRDSTTYGCCGATVELFMMR